MRKFLAMVLSFIICASTVSTVANAAKFTDVPASDATLTKAVDLLSSVGITTGTTETTYGTSQGVTRQQMATFIFRLMKAGKTVEGKQGDNNTTFTDLDDPFYYFMISWANDMGIIKGRNETTFDPKGGIILQDAYVMLVRALGYEKDKTLAYPFDYINVAERIGLDEGIPADVNYDTALTRGNVAILLYNAFYADMAPAKVTVAPGVEMDAKATNVAKSIFGIEYTVQRVVATPNYSLDGQTTEGEGNLVELRCLDLELSKEGHDGIFGTVDFEELGLKGNADDYFLIDLAIYYKPSADGEHEIVAASPLGTRTESISGKDIKFETTPDYSYQSDGNIKAATGKVTINGQVAYLFDAPYSYSKYENDEECMTLLFLGKTQRDPEAEDYVPDFNFEAHRDAFGNRSSYNDAPNLWKKVGSEWVKVTTSMKDDDPRGYGMYTMGGAMYIMGISLTATTYEADTWDSNGDGKIDYLWLKPYTVGKAVEDEGEQFIERHSGNEDRQDRFSCIIDPPVDSETMGKVFSFPTIYTYGANKDGQSFEDGQLIIGYINGPANYIKCNSARDIEYQLNQVFDTRSSSTTFGFNGKSAGRTDGLRGYIGLPDNNGERGKLLTVGDNYPWYAAYANNYFISSKLGTTYKIVYLGNYILHAIPTNTVFEGDEDYAIIFPNRDNRYAYTASVGIVENGDLQKSGNMIEALIDGELTNIIVKPQTSSALAAKDPFMPVTKKQPNDVYDFSDYAGKLLTYTVDSKGVYTFRIAPLSENTDAGILTGDDPTAYYTFEAEETPEVTGAITSAFVNTANNMYQFYKTKTNKLNTDVYPGRYVAFTENTKVIIKTINEDEEPVFKVYDKDNMPNFSKDDDLANIKYVVRNNPNSKTTEELIYLYAEASDGKTTVKPGKTLDYRFVVGSKIVIENENTIVYYDVFNPFTGKLEEEYETSDDSECTVNGIYSLAGGYINNKNLLGTIGDFGAAATSETTSGTTGLGLAEIDGYDDENEILVLNGEDLIFKVDENTKISFINLDKKTIESKTKSILNSTSNAYRCKDNKDMPLLAFVASSKIKGEDEIEHAEVICIVRYNALDE